MATKKTPASKMAQSQKHRLFMPELTALTIMRAAISALLPV